MTSWQLQEAKARFSEFLDAALKKEPQVVTRRGIEAAVLVPIDEWKRLQLAARPGLKELLLTSEGRFEHLFRKDGRCTVGLCRRLSESVFARHQRRFRTAQAASARSSRRLAQEPGRAAVICVGDDTG